MLLRSTLVYLPATLAPRAISFFALLLFTHLLPKSEFGLLSLVVMVGEACDMSFSGWLRLAFMRVSSDRILSWTLVNRVAVLTAGTAALSSTVALVVGLFLVPGRAWEFAFAVLVYLIAVTTSRLVLTILQVQERRAEYSILEVIRATVWLVGSIAGAYLIQPSFLAVSISGSAGSLLVTCAGFLLLTASVPRVPAEVPYRELLGFAGPLILVAMLGFAVLSADRGSLQYLFGPEVVAIYAAAYGIARQPIDVIANSVNTGGYPRIIGLAARGDAAGAQCFISHQLLMMLALLLPTAALIAALREDIVATVLPASYASEAAAVIPLITLAGVIYNVRTGVFDNVFHALKRNWVQLTSLVPAVIAGLVLAPILAAQWGAQGAAAAFLTWVLISLLTSAVFGRSELTPTLKSTELLALAGVVVATFGAAEIAIAFSGGSPGALRLVIGGVAGGSVFLIAAYLLLGKSLRGKVREEQGT